MEWGAGRGRDGEEGGGREYGKGQNGLRWEDVSIQEKKERDILSSWKNRNHLSNNEMSNVERKPEK